jgi:hypothetical protein
VSASHPSGRVTGGFRTRAGERIWLVAWDDGKARELIDIEPTPEFEIGQRVVLIGRKLISTRQAA